MGIIPFIMEMPYDEFEDYADKIIQDFLTAINNPELIYPILYVIPEKIDIRTFSPFPKNPTISKIFRKIGLADELGSGMRNTNKYTVLYSEEEPIFFRRRYLQNDNSIKTYRHN